MSIDEILTEAADQLRQANRRHRTPEFSPPPRLNRGFLAAGLAIASLTAAISLAIALSGTTSPGIPSAGTAQATAPPDGDGQAGPAVSPTATTALAAEPLCPGTMPFDIGVPDDFSGPFSGPSPFPTIDVEVGQFVQHWLGRDGSIELRWPPSTTITKDAVWGERLTGPSSLVRTGIIAHERFEGDAMGTSLYGYLPSDTMTGPCDAAQLDSFLNLGPDTPARSVGTDGHTSRGDQLIYFPNLERTDDLIVGTRNYDVAPEVVRCQGQGGSTEDTPPNVVGTVDDGPTFETTREVLSAFLTTAEAAVFPNTGYWELTLPDSDRLVFGHPIDNRVEPPNPDEGLIFAVTAIRTADGWRVVEYSHSGC